MPYDEEKYIIAMNNEAYSCTLSENALRVATEELNEDSRERLGHVEALRVWINQQRHFTAPTDTRTLLKFLRTAKFSQLRARKMLENNIHLRSRMPDWLCDIDMADPGIQKVLDTGYVVFLPKTLPDGRRFILSDAGALTFDGSITKLNVIRTLFGMTSYYTMDESDLVNGTEFFMDMSNFSMKTMTFWGMDTMKKLQKIWQGNFPGRFKAFHYFNTGSVFESLMAVCRPLLSQKFQDRIQVHGKNMEDVFKMIPMECFPDEYLPDDYEGSSQGSMKSIIKKMKDDLKSPRVRNRILYETSSRWKYDTSQKPQDIPSESFRKLNIN